MVAVMERKQPYRERPIRELKGDVRRHVRLDAVERRIDLGRENVNEE